MTDGQKQHIKQLHKATEIIRDDPDALSPIDRQRLRLDLQELQTVIGMGMHYQQTDAEPGVPERYLKEMVDGLRDALTKLADGDYPIDIDMEPKDVHVRVYVRAATPVWVSVNLPAGRDSAIYAFYRHFEGSGLTPDRVRRCPGESCGNIFVLGSHARTDRMRYCSVRCSRLAATLAYRERQTRKKRKRRSNWEMLMGAKKRRRQEQGARSTTAKKRGEK
jgi:hypothetical protein